MIFARYHTHMVQLAEGDYLVADCKKCHNWERLGYAYIQIDGCKRLLRKPGMLREARSDLVSELEDEGGYWSRSRAFFQRYQGYFPKNQMSREQVCLEFRKALEEMERRYRRYFGVFDRNGLLQKATEYIRTPLVTLSWAFDDMGLTKEYSETIALLKYYACKCYADHCHQPIQSRPLSALFLCANAGHLQAILEFGNNFCPQIKIRGIEKLDVARLTA